MSRDKRDRPKQGFSHTPFKELRAKLEPSAKVERKTVGPRASAAVAGKPSAAARGAHTSESELFEQAMAGVTRILDERGSLPPPPPREPVLIDDEAEGLACLAELVAGEGPFDISDTSEHIEGTAPGVDRRLLQKLKRGEFAVQGHLDLHGMVRGDAKDAVERFLAESRRLGKRCVLVVHGRGLNSKDQIPVLKESLKLWLHRGRIGKSVLAFATARPHDGGAGAVYLLLRR
jgi:DNA-nicking Smr family endonuclease